MVQITLLPGIWSTMRVYWRCQMCMAPFFVLKAWYPYLITRADQITGACIASHHHQGWYHRVLKAASWAYCSVAATLQATEVIKVLLGLGNVSSGKLLVYNALKMSFKELKITKKDDYEINELIDYDQFCGIPQQQEENVIPEISVERLKEKIDANEDFTLIDVREETEFEICNINGQLMPLNELESFLGDLDKSKEYVVHCKMGGRSARAVAEMQEAGFTNVSNLAGGILAWIDKIDASLIVILIVSFQ